VLGTEGTGRHQISVGLWQFATDAKVKLAAKAGLSTEVSKLWFERAFGKKQRPELAQVG
jgi:hypothetical protein